MPDKPLAEVAIDVQLVRSLIASQTQSQIPDSATLPLRKVSEGWDNDIWKLGHHLAVRLPRRALAAPLIEHEHFALPLIAPALNAAGLRTPLPLHRGTPSAEYPWPWSVVPWLAGSCALDQPRSARTSWAPQLSRALVALHTTAPAQCPANPFRGVPLTNRDDAVASRLAMLEATGTLTAREATATKMIWQSGRDAAQWHAAPVWVHGDLHPGNLLTLNGSLHAIIDFGDVTSGDPAYDLAAAWLTFDPVGRTAFVAATNGRYDAAAWTRARAWAVAVALMLLAHSDDNPAYARLGRASLSQALAG